MDMETQVYDEVEKVNEQTGETKTTHTSWSGTLTFNIPSLNWNDELLHVSMGKAHGNQTALEITHKSMETGFYYGDGTPLLYTQDGTVNTSPFPDLCKEVESRETEQLFRYQERAKVDQQTGLPIIDDKTGSPIIEKINITPIEHAEGKEKVRYAGGDGQEWKVFPRQKRAYFDSESLSTSKWLEVSPSFVIDVETTIEADGSKTENIVSPFVRTKDLHYTEENIVPLSRIGEYKFKEIYMVRTNQDKKIRENPDRIHKKARELLEKQIAVVEFFSWGKIGASGGYTYYNAVLFPYERKEDGKLWLLHGMSEGILTLDELWALEKSIVPIEASPVPTAKKPKVRLVK